MKSKRKLKTVGELDEPSLSTKEAAEALRLTYKRLNKSLLVAETEKAVIETASQPGQPLSPSNTLHFLKCPPKQLSHCCFYEFARCSDGMVSLAEEFHQGRLLDKSSPDDWPTNEMLARIPLWIIADCPEFPNTAWLDLPADRRATLSKRTRPTFGPADQSAFRDINEALDFVDALRMLKKHGLIDSDAGKLDSRIDVQKLLKQVEVLDLTQDRSELLKALSTDDPTSDLAQFIRALKARALARRVSGFQSALETIEMAPHLAEMLPSHHMRFLVEVDLRRDKADLVKDYMAWIDRKKAEFKRLFAGHENSFENRGRSDSPRDLLRKLSAYRIHRELEWTHDKLTEHFTQIYAKPSHWSKAINDCKRLMER